MDTASNLDLPDNVKLRLGTSQDLEIYHDASDSLINDNGTGSLKLQTGGSTKLEVTSTGVDVTGNIAVSGTVDGVDIAARDAVLTSTTTTAGAALPRTGGAMTGAITTNSTFDGRDVATDGAKLDGIESGATADQTQSEINALGITATGLSGTPAISVANITTTGELRGPASFVVDPAAVGDNTGTVIIKGNLQVDGATTTINSTTLTVDDLNITLASGAANGTAANGAGITVDGASATITYNSTGDSWDFNKNINLGDNRKAIFGDGSDFEIYFNGNHGVMRTASASVGGNIYIQDDNNIVLGSIGGENYLNAAKDGAVTLYYDNAAKLATTSTGIDVTGTVTADGLTVDASTASMITLNHSTPSNLTTIGQDSSGDFRVRSDNVNKLKSYANGDFELYEDTGTTAKLFWDASTERLGIGTSSPGSLLELEATGSTVFDGTSTDGQSADGTTLAIQNLSDTNNTFSQILFRNRNTSKAVSRIASLTDSTGTEMAFVVENNGSPAEVLRLEKTGKVGIGTSSPAAKLHIENGDMRIEKDTKATIGFRGHTTGSTALAFRDSNAGVDRMTIDSSGNVGIGTTPQSFSKLQVKATTDQHVSIFTNSSGLTIGGLTDNGGSGALRIAGAPLHLTGQGGGAGSGPDIAIISGGNVGIGTDNPQAKLHVTSNVLIEGGSTDSRTLGFTNASGSTGWSIGNGIIDSTHNFRIYDNTAGAARVTVDGNGNVGIGDIAPADKLEVNGGATYPHIRITSSNNTSRYMRIGMEDAINHVVEANGTSTNLKFKTAGSTRLTIGSTGNVNFGGNITGVNDLSIADQIIHTGDTNTYMQFHGADSWRVVTAGSERLHIEGASVVFNHDGHDADFRVESNDNTHMLFVDGGNNKIGINEPNPAASLDIRQSTNSNTDGLLVRPVNESQSMIYSFLGMRSTYFTHFVTDSANSGNANYEYFKFFAGTEDINGELLQLHDDYTVFNEGGLDRNFRVESSGNANMLHVDGGNNSVGIGTTGATTASLVVQANSGAGGIGIVGRSNGGIGSISLYDDNGTTSVGYIQGRADDTQLRLWGTQSGGNVSFAQNNTERLRITSYGGVHSRNGHLGTSYTALNSPDRAYWTVSTFNDNATVTSGTVSVYTSNVEWQPVLLKITATSINNGQGNFSNGVFYVRIAGYHGGGGLISTVDSWTSGTVSISVSATDINEHHMRINITVTGQGNRTVASVEALSYGGVFETARTG